MVCKKHIVFMGAVMVVTAVFSFTSSLGTAQEIGKKSGENSSLQELAKRVNALGRISFFSEIPGAPKQIVILEDAHCNFPVQQKLETLIEQSNDCFKTQGSLTRPLVVQEGGAMGEIDTSILTKDKTPEAARAFLDDALKAGNMGAAEYLHAKKNDFIFAGIEDASLYDADYEQFMNIAVKRSDLEKLLVDLEDKLESIRRTMFQTELNDFYEAMKKQSAGSSDIAGYIVRLHYHALEYTVDLKKYPALMNCFESADSLENLNLQKLSEEFDLLKKYRSAICLSNDVSGITAPKPVCLPAAANHQRSSKERPELAKLEDTVALFDAGIITLGSYPELFRYGKLQAILRKSIGPEFVEQKEGLEEELLTRMATTDEEKALVAVMLDFLRAQKILGFQLTRDEYLFFRTQIGKTNEILGKTIAYIRTFYQAYEIPFTLEALSKSAEGFYTLAEKRDVMLVNNTLSLMDKFAVSSATMIIGGFHTDGIRDLLVKKNISVMVVTPCIDSVDDHASEKYYDVMGKFWQARNS
jgi:hypothetical protein